MSYAKKYSSNQSDHRPRTKSLKQKNGYVLIADIGLPSSRLLPNKRTYAEQVKDCLIIFIQQKIFINNASDDIAIILCGSDTTKNSLGYQNIQVLWDMEKVSWGAAKCVNEVVRTKNFEGDWMDALGVALDLVHRKVKAGNIYDSIQIIFFTTFESPFKTSERTQKAYISALLAEKTSLFIVGSNLDQESLEDEKKMNKGELVAYQLMQEASGAFYSFGDFSASMLHCTEQPKLGAPWNVTLDIGSKIQIPISAYIKVKKSESLKWSEETSTEEALVDRERTYQKEQSNAMIDREDVISAYKYGSKLIPVSIEEEKHWSYKSGNRCLSVLAFVDPIPPQFGSGTGTKFIFPHRKAGVVDRSAQIALSALINAMAEAGKVAIVRHVYNNNTRLAIGVLAPRIKFKYECLVFHELPFAEDWRQYEFSPIITPKSKPSAEQVEAIDELIDKLDLSGAEEFDSTKMSDPYEEYIRNVIGFKVLNPDDPLPDIPPHIKMNLQPAPSLMEGAKDVLNRVQQLFPLQVTDNLKAKNFETSKRWAIPATEEDAEIEKEAKKTKLDETGEVDLESIFRTKTVIGVGTANPVKDFSHLLQMGKKPVEEVYEEMSKVIVKLLEDGGGTNAALMDKAKSCVQAYREQALSQGHVVYFNRWMEQFKEHVVSNYFTDFWQNYVAKSRLGLITKEESPLSAVEKQKAEQFLRLSENVNEIESVDEDEELLNLIE